VRICRGATASPQDTARVAALICELERSSSDADAAARATLDGTWRLVWSSVEPFRSSPFFWAFMEGLVQNRMIAAKIFQFTDRCAFAKSKRCFAIPCAAALFSRRRSQ